MYDYWKSPLVRIYNEITMSPELDAQRLYLAYDVWTGLLRHRDDVDGSGAFRYCALWCGSISSLPAAERSHDHRWAGVEQDGAGDPAIVGADAGAEVGNFHGSLCHLGRRFQ